MKHSSDKKTVLITGGTGGIGSAVVDILDPEEWNVVITGRRNSTLLSDMQTKYGLKLAFEWDAGDKDAMKCIVDKIIDEYGRIDSLVNCVGVTYSKPFDEIDEETTLSEYKINVLGTIYPIQEVLSHMSRSARGGKIVNVSSLRGLAPLASMRSITYSMTKAAIISLTAALAKQYGPHIQINAIAPGFTVTRMSDNWSDSTWLSAMDKNIYQRPAQATEIAEHISFLLSDKCTYLAGQTILVDGGYSLFDK